MIDGVRFEVLTDIGESYVLWIENAVLHFKRAAPATDANATLTLTKPIFIKMMTGTAGVQDTLLSDDLEVDGSNLEGVSTDLLLRLWGVLGVRVELKFRRAAWRTARSA